MISAGNTLKVSCGDVNDQAMRRIARISVSKALLGDLRVFRKGSGLRREKKPLLDEFKRDLANKELLLKLLRGISWEKLDRGFQTLFSLDIRGSSVARWIGKKYNSRKITSTQIRTVWRQVFQNRPNTLMCSANPSSSPPTRPVTPTPPQPRPADPQLKLQQALVAAVRKVYGASTSESSAKTVLKTQKWTTLKQLGIASNIMKAFGRLRYRRAARIPRVARRLLKRTLRKWKASSGTPTQTPTRPSPPPPRRVPPRRPTTPPPTHPVTPTPPQPRPAGTQLALQQALVAAVRKVYGATTSESSAKTVLKTQKWSTLKQLGIASDIQKAFGRIGYVKEAKSSRAARRLLKRILRKWQ